MAESDSVLAQKIVGLSRNNYSDKSLFSNTSQIYIKSNERIDDYIKYLRNKKDVLSVIASGDQIINMVLNGSKNIDAFDISVFPKYYLFLKLGALKCLTREQYLDFFYRLDKDDEEYDDMYYDLIRYNLDSNTKEFWTSLIDFFDWKEITSSPLFSSEEIDVSDVIIQNEYLENDKYSKLKNMVDNVNINTFNGNIFDLDFKDKYDLIYLSNIIYYNNIKKYKELMDSYKLNSNGIILSYLYNSLDRIDNYFSDDSYYVEKFKNNNAGVLIKKYLN